jgi:transcriptional regulator GlxA family with amidase domain
MRCEILLFPGAEELDALAPCEVLGVAGITTTLVSLDGPKPLRLAHGAVITPHGTPGYPEILIIPGGGWASRAESGARVEAENPRMLDFLRDAHTRGAVIAGVCTGTMLLACAGLLKGRSAITHHSAIEDLRALGIEVINERVVDAGDIVTCGGVTSGLDLALWLVERFCGRERAETTEAYLEYERRGTVHRDPA